MARWARRLGVAPQTILGYGKAPQQRMRAHIATPKRRLPKPLKH
jgi:hypothetical protein